MIGAEEDCWVNFIKKKLIYKCYFQPIVLARSENNRTNRLHL